MQQLSALDTLFLSIEKPNTPMHTAGVVVLEGAADFHDVYETIRSRLHLVPRFTQRIAPVPFGIGRPYWVADPNFDLSFHLRHAAVPAPGTDVQLCEYASRLISRPLDRSRPLWEMYYVNGLEHGRSAFVTKTHHAMIDGLATMDLATVLFDFTPQSQAHEAPKAKKSAPLPSGRQLLKQAVTSQARELMNLQRTLRSAASAPGRIASGLRDGLLAVASTAHTAINPAKPSPLNTGPGLHRRYAFVRSTLQTIKDIKNSAGATVNDVILSVCADALGKLFRSRDEPTEARTLRTMVPVSVRDDSRKGALGNEIAAVFPDLPIGEMGAFDRLKLIHLSMAGVKDSSAAVGAELLVNSTSWMPATLHSLAARVGNRARLMNLVISNVPGPQVPLYSCGQKMLEPYAVIPLSRGQTLAIGVTSYNQGIFFGLNADRDAHPDLQLLAGFIDESIKEFSEGGVGDFRASHSVRY